MLVLAGGIVRVWSPRVERADRGETVTMDAKEEVAGFWNRSLPTSWLTGSVLVVLVGLAIAGAYVYFPSPEEMFADIRIVRADALSAVQTRARDARSVMSPIGNG